MRYGLMSVILLFLLNIGASFAQQEEVVITLTVAEYERDNYRKTIIPEFEAQNPGIRVHLNTGNNTNIYWSEYVDGYLDSVATLAQASDVMKVSQNLQRDATRAGYILDLAPLVRSDMTINQADYYPSAWESFTWDGGIWAVPSNIDTYLLFYDASAFDDAGLAYPNETWTVHDYANAVRGLSDLSPEGYVSKYAIEMFYESSTANFFISLLGSPIYDDNGFAVDMAKLEEITNVWGELNREGYFSVEPNEDGSFTLGGQNERPTPMAVIPATMGALFSNTDYPYSVTYLPNSYVGLQITGYAVSGGTRYPEASYALAKFLSNHPLVIQNEFFGRAADRTFNSVESSSLSFNPLDDLPAEARDFVVNSFEYARPAFEQQFAYYINSFSDENEAYTISDLAEKIEERFQVSNERLNTPIVVNDPPQRVQLSAGEIELKFRLAANVSPFPNRERWESFAREFAQNHPTVGNVELDFGFYNPLEAMTEQYDCFYSTESMLKNNPNLSLLLSLDPYLSTDAENVSQDFVAGVLDQVRIDGLTWAFPLVLASENLIYIPELFDQANAGDPSRSWTISDFENSLWALSNIMEDGKAPFVPEPISLQYFYMLILAYGGQPFDFSTDPITLNFTDEATLNAVKQVLDLYRNDLMTHVPMSEQISFYSGSSSSSVPLRTNSSDGMGGSTFISTMSADGSEFVPPTQYIIPYPSGSLYSPMAYTVSSAYISANTPHADECYQFIREVSKQTDLLVGQMPTLISVLNSPDLVASHNQANVDFYRTYEAQLNQPNSFVLPAMDMAYYGGGLSETMWIYRVFDDYVENGEQVDLLTDLTEAQVLMTEHLACIAELPDMMSLESQEDFQVYIDGYKACITDIDPSIDLSWLN